MTIYRTASPKRLAIGVLIGVLFMWFFVLGLAAYGAPGPDWKKVTCPASGTIEVGSSVNRVSVLLWNTSGEISVLLKQNTSGIASGAPLGAGNSVSLSSSWKSVPTASYPIYCQGIGDEAILGYMEVIGQ